jgi:hypothetical protein
MPPKIGSEMPSEGVKVSISPAEAAPSATPTQTTEDLNPVAVPNRPPVGTGQIGVDPRTGAVLKGSYTLQQEVSPGRFIKTVVTNN